MTPYEESQRLIEQVPINEANFEHIARTGQINGSLMSSLCELLIKQKKEVRNGIIHEIKKKIGYRSFDVDGNHVVIEVQKLQQYLTSLIIQ
jgi:hypothetical protein